MPRKWTPRYRFLGRKPTGDFLGSKPRAAKGPGLGRGMVGGDAGAAMSRCHRQEARGVLWNHTGPFRDIPN